VNILLTKRLVLRPWSESDAQSLYEYAKDPRIGPIAGWPVHTSAQNSREIIHDILSAEGTYAVTVKDDGAAIGSIGLMIGDKSNLGLPETEAEIGYWIGVPFWGMGYIPEAVLELMRHAFEELCLNALWCGYFDGNEKSKRVGEKCGFSYHHSVEKFWPLINETKLQHITRLAKDEWRVNRGICSASSIAGRRGSLLTVWK
jgi:RimJ/RimL family protein N-acetyltransferase